MDEFEFPNEVAGLVSSDVNFQKDGGRHVMVQYIVSSFRVDHCPVGIRMNIILEHIAREKSKHLAVMGIDANGHVGLARDLCTRMWCPTVSSNIFGKEP